MTASVGAAGWYLDPELPGFQRYFDGANWTEHRSPLPAPPSGFQGWWTAPQWKGSKLGLPPNGPGSLADPARRLGARLLDTLVLLPVFAGVVTLTVVLVAPHVGPIFPPNMSNQNPSAPPPGFVWIELAFFGAVLFMGLVVLAYETIATARYGRTLGKAWLHIRPLRTDGSKLRWGRSFGRVAISWLAGLFSGLGILDVLWCLWDDNRQCIHDKAVDTIVVNDLPASGHVGPSHHPGYTPGAQPWGPSAPPAAWQPSPLASYASQPYYWGAPPTTTGTSGFAIASLVCSIVAVWFFGVPAIPGIIFGFVARIRIRRSAGTLKGSGLALAGIIVGFAAVALWALIFAAAAFGDHHTS